MNVVRQRLERRDVNDLRRIRKRRLEALSHQVIDAARKAASVLPEPVGAAMRVWRPALIAGQASACAGVGEAKLSANQFATAGWNRVSTPADARDAAELSPAPVRAFEIEAKSECKRVGSPRTPRNCVRLYMAPDRTLVTLASCACRKRRLGPRL